MIRNGSDILVYMGDEAIAYSTSHKIDYSAETKERAHKDIEDPTWPELSVTKQSATITVEALVGKEKGSYEKLLAAFKAKQPVTCKYSEKNMAAGGEYEEGKFIITALSRTDPTNEDSTFSATFNSSGKVETKTQGES